MDPFGQSSTDDEKNQVVFWDGISKLADQLDSQYRLTKRWIDRLASDHVRRLYVHVFFGGDVNSSISDRKPCCLSFSFMDIKGRRFTLAIHVAAPFFPLVFSCDLFRGLKDALLDRNVEKVFLSTAAANAAHSIFLRCFKINVRFMCTVLKDDSEWRDALDRSESRAVLARYARFVTQNREEVIDTVVRPAEFSLSAAESLSVGERDLLSAVVVLLHTVMIAIHTGEFTVRRYVATGSYFSSARY